LVFPQAEVERSRHLLNDGRGFKKDKDSSNSGGNAIVKTTVANLITHFVLHSALFIIIVGWDGWDDRQKYEIMQTGQCFLPSNTFSVFSKLSKKSNDSFIFIDLADSSEPVCTPTSLLSFLLRF
jgi:hypothetical protein